MQSLSKDQQLAAALGEVSDLQSSNMDRAIQFFDPVEQLGSAVPPERAMKESGDTIDKADGAQAQLEAKVNELEHRLAEYGEEKRLLELRKADEIAQIHSTYVKQLRELQGALSRAAANKSIMVEEHEARLQRAIHEVRTELVNEFSQEQEGGRWQRSVKMWQRRLCAYTRS